MFKLGLVYALMSARPSRACTTAQVVQNQPQTARATPHPLPEYQQDDDMMMVNEEPSELPPHPQLKPMEEWLGLREDYLNILLQSEGLQNGLTFCMDWHTLFFWETGLACY
ncbi:hypothetical protein BC834DRAFT_847575 [Gloeopeniophorella convolvens]|nr:hypothetical protein BC834DRAFT_847575 [Gloeopeniophorella convolvens]